jgi:predicted permease
VAGRIFDSIRQDVRYALRGFRRAPGLTLIAFLVLAAGITANTTIFSVVNAVLLRPLPVQDPDDLRFLSVFYASYPRGRATVPYRTFEQLSERGDVFSGVAGFFGDSAKLGSGISTSAVVGERVTTGYFHVLGVRAALGRTFVPADDEPGADPVVVISDRFWRRRLGANPHVLGTTIDFRAARSSRGRYLRHHRVYTVIGVMPPEFKGVMTVWIPIEYWVPMRQRVNDVVQEQAEISGATGDRAKAIDARLASILVARPRPDVNDAQVRTVLLAAERDMPETRGAAPGVRPEKGVILSDRSLPGALPFDPTGRVVPARLAVALMIVPVLVLLIAASNLAGLLMARSVARRGEVAVRLALGAGRGRIARQMLTESLLLSSAGAVAAIALSRLLIDVFTAYMPRLGGVGVFSVNAVSLDVPLDGRVLLFTIALSVGTGVFIGMSPAIQALRTDILTALAGGGTAQAASPRTRLRRWIVVPQICLSLVLLLAAAVLVRALLRAELADRGFDPDHVLYVDIAMPQPRVAAMTPQEWTAENARSKAAHLELLQTVRTVPGVEAASLANKAAWTGRGSVPVASRDSYRERQDRWVAGADVSIGYFETMSIPILRGRAFDVRDTDVSTPVAVVDERLAQLLWPGKDPLGEYIASPDPATTAPPTWRRVIGLVREVRIAGGEDRPTPILYRPIEQLPRMPDSSILVRARGTPGDLLKTVPGVIAGARSDTEVPRARTMNEEIGEILYPARLGATVLAVSGVFGLLLSVLGLYGVVSYSSAQRLREIGIRSALGAERRDLVALLLGDALRALAVAVVTGIALGFAAVRLVSSMVVALPRLDAVTLITIPLVLSGVIVAACLRPVRRAARVNPIDVLRAL